jgi:hypothetical protein
VVGRGGGGSIECDVVALLALGGLVFGVLD